MRRSATRGSIRLSAETSPWLELRPPPASPARATNGGDVAPRSGIPVVPPRRRPRYLPCSPTPPPTPTSRRPRSGRRHPLSGASTTMRSPRVLPLPLPLSAQDSALPSNAHAMEVAPSPASRYRVESLIRTSGECESLLLTMCSVN
ncbi:hypothetical protein PVAP13_8KG224000 [Panicum virgatum]|uniref:Uncharacterized protein n=1 Tax=Panicum virgatum TaxID=38727 RepID=A0A8T0PLB7_PANVG|nr:hypothetical protein PVAP13_8KG224000 [Panicum virgatum]